MNTQYVDFLSSKFQFRPSWGFEATAADLHPLLKPHQRDIALWALQRGRAAIFAAFGLGKSLLQIEILRLIQQREGGRVLVIAPLGVRLEFIRDAAKVGVEVRFVRRTEEAQEPGFYLTNYESVRDGKLDVGLFTAVSLDEASVLRSYGSKTYQEFLGLFRYTRYRFVATATPSPNRHKELIHYAGFLGIMDTGQALTRFFQRDSSQANNLTLYPHMTQEFYLWLHSWAIFVQTPSEVCRCVCHKERKSKDSVSEGLRLSNGTPKQNVMGPGSADATAAACTMQPLATSKPAASLAADASTPSTDGKVPGCTLSGEELSPELQTQITKIGRTTAAGASVSANAGRTSLPSCKTWESHPPNTLLSGSTTSAAMSQETAAGQRDLTKLETAGPEERRRAQDENGYCGLCRCDEGYDLPPLTVRYHEVAVSNLGGKVDRDGQIQLVNDAALGLKDAAEEKRNSIDVRVAKVAQLVSERPNDHVIIWHDLEAERHAINAAIPGAVDVYGSQDLDEREERIIGFSEGAIQRLSTKPELAGSGCNFQYHCHWAIFSGIGYKFNDFVQAIHRIQRFQQPFPVEIDIIYTETERAILDELKRKWEEDKQLRRRMSRIIRKYGLSTTGMEDELRRTIGVERVVERGAHFEVALNDCVAETAQMPEDAVDLICTSIPFGNHYEYSPSYNDFGHNEDNERFFAQMDFLTPNLLRILRPGRVAAIHVKDRIRFGNVTGDGMPTVEPFHADCIAHYRKHGFRYMGMITVVTDVVRENNQTYRLGWSEQCKDGTKMGVGSPEYVLLFRKLPSDTSKAYADTRVEKPKQEYTRARWQTDAHAFWRSSGNRLVSAEEMSELQPEQIGRAYETASLAKVYDHEEHVELGEALDRRGVLPATFMSLAPGSHHPDVWHDVNRMLTLNGSQTQRGLANHICPLQFDIVDRIIRRYTNEGDTVFDPFGGLFTVPYRAIHLRRRGQACELNPEYFRDGVRYLREAEAKRDVPTLFDLLPTEPQAA